MKTLIRKSLFLLTALAPALSQAIVVGPYTPDVNTVFLFHLDELAGTTAAVNANGTIAASTNAVAYKQNTATANNSPTDATILGISGASGFTFGNFGRAAYITNTVAAGVVSNGIGIDMNGNGAFNLNNGNSPNNGDSLANSSLILGPNNSFTLEALINLPDTNAGNREIICADNAQTRGFQFRVSGANIELNMQPGVSATANDFLVPIPKTGLHAFVPNTWFHVALVHSEVGGSPTNIIYWTALNDLFTAANAILTTNSGAINTAAQLILDIGNEARGTGGSTEGLRGGIDEVRISRGARSATQMMFTDGTITISQQPQPQVVPPGATAIFSATASSPISAWAPLGYQWRSNGVALVDGGDFSGVMTPTLVIGNAQAAYEANYDVVITNLYQTNISAIASLTVHVPLNLSWRGTVDFNWNTGTSNWFDTVNLADSIFTGGDLVTFDDSGNNASPIVLVGSLLPGSVTVNSALPYTFGGSGKISGATGLTKSNSGVLTIQNANDYIGVTTLGGGTVSVSLLANGLSPSAIGASAGASANLVFDGGDLQYTGPTVNINRGATLNPGGGAVEVTANSLALSGVVVGTGGGSLTKTGSGTLALGGANSYDGATIVSAGTLQLTGSGTFGGGNVTNNSALLLSGTRSVPNLIAGTGSLTNDTGILTLGGANSYAGPTTISGGLVVANSSSLGNSPQVTVNSTTGGALGGTRVTLNAGVAVPSVSALSLPSLGTTVRSTLFAAGASSWNGPITLIGDNTVSPGDQIAFAGSGGSLTIGGNITGVNFPGTLQLRGDGSGNGGAGGSVLGTFSLAGNATVQVNDGVTWTIGSTGNSWGITEIAKGTLQIGQNNALPVGTSVKLGAAGNANLDLAGFSQQIAGLTNVASVTVVGNSSTTTDSTLVYSTIATSTFGGSIVDSLASGTKKTALTVNDGTLILTASNSFSGPTVIGETSSSIFPTLALGPSGSINNTPSIAIYSFARLDVSAIASYSLSPNTALTIVGVATNFPTIVGGTTVNLGSQPITFDYVNVHTMLDIAQGTLSLNGNPITVNSGFGTFPAGTYLLAFQANGNISSSGPFPQATGTAFAPGTTNFITANGPILALQIQNVSTTTLTRTIGTSPSTYGTPLRFHAVVTPAPLDGETISFFAGATLIGTATTGGGAADLDIANLPASGLAYTITASYPGDAVTTASGGTLAGDQFVNPATVTPAVSVASKIYDGTTAATITARSLAGVIGSDDVNLGTSGTATFASANVGTAVSVSVSGLALSGITAGNYVLSSTSIATNADITPATLTYVADAANRAYGAANPTFTGSVTGFVNGENQAGATTGTLTFTSPATAASAPGSYAINGSGLTANNGNYTFVQAAGNATALTVGPVTVTPIVTVSNKIYDGTTNATVASRTLQGVIGTDDVALDTNDVAFFASANVGTGISVTISNLTLTGSVATNYVLSTNVVTTNADITPATLTYVADPANRFYATANPDFTGTVTGFVNGENLGSSTTGTLTFASPATPASLPSSYPIDGSGLTANFGNYVFVQAAGNATALTITVNTTLVSLSLDRVNNSAVLAPNSIIVSWPADHLGWRLQLQTNSLSSGIWTDIPGSSATNQVILTPDSLTGVYRLIYP
jgi:autotransporter-associated beta strand protein